MLRSLFSAFLMYSRIPVPKVEWKEENRRYALGFFPLVGAVIGALLILWRFACNALDTGQFLFAAGAVFIPVLVTGGIHLDGFCDVCDARASCADKAKRLEIMSDPHIGSFAVIKLCLYFIIQTALFSQVDSLRTTALISVGYVLSRALSGLSAVTFKIIASVSAMAAILPIQGVTAGLAALFVFICHRFTSYRDFGGVTGDLCGWFLQMCEIFIPAAIVFSGRIMQLWL